MASSSDKKSSEKTPIISVCKEKPDLRKKEPPLVNVSISNPVTYLKAWWKKVIGKEGIDLRFRIHPLTAIAITIIVATLGFGIGRFALSWQKPFVKFVPAQSPSPIPTPDSWRETAFSGILRFSTVTKKYYLMTASSEAINLQAPATVDLEALVGRRIFATGKYNDLTRTLVVVDVADLEILPEETEPVPLVSPPPTPLTTSSPTPWPTPEPEAEIIEETPSTTSGSL